MENVTYTSSAPFIDASDKAIKRVITVYVNGRYDDTMVVSADASEKEISDLYHQRSIDAEKTKASWGWYGTTPCLKAFADVLCTQANTYNLTETEKCNLITSICAELALLLDGGLK